MSKNNNSFKQALPGAQGTGENKRQKFNFVRRDCKLSLSFSPLPPDLPRVPWQRVCVQAKATTLRLYITLFCEFLCYSRMTTTFYDFLENVNDINLNKMIKSNFRVSDLIPQARSLQLKRIFWATYLNNWILISEHCEEVWVDTKSMTFSWASLCLKCKFSNPTPSGHW